MTTARLAEFLTNLVPQGIPSAKPALRAELMRTTTHEPHASRNAFLLRSWPRSLVVDHRSCLAPAFTVRGGGRCVAATPCAVTGCISPLSSAAWLRSPGPDGIAVEPFRGSAAARPHGVSTCCHDGCGWCGLPLLWLGAPLSPFSGAAALVACLLGRPPSVLSLLGASIFGNLTHPLTGARSQYLSPSPGLWHCRRFMHLAMAFPSRLALSQAPLLLGASLFFWYRPSSGLTPARPPLVAVAAVSILKKSIG